MRKMGMETVKKKGFCHVVKKQGFDPWVKPRHFNQFVQECFTQLRKIQPLSHQGIVSWFIQ